MYAIIVFAKYCWSIHSKVARLAKNAQRKLRKAFPWGAVRKNIISDRFSTKTGISAHI